MIIQIALGIVLGWCLLALFIALLPALMKAVCWLVVLAAGAAAVYWLGYVVYSLAAMSWEDRFMALLGFAIFGGMIALTAWNERALIRKAEAERERRAAQLPPPLPEGKP